MFTTLEYSYLINGYEVLKGALIINGSLLCESFFFL